MPQGVTIRGLPRAFAMIKAMQDQGYEWGEDYRQCGRAALVEILEMDDAIDRQLAAADIGGEADRRDGSYPRHLVTELGDIELSVPRTRRFSALGVVWAYAWRAPPLDRMILSCFVFGLSTRKVATALLVVLGRPVSPQTVNRVARTLDAAVATFHRRRLADRNRVLMLDGVVLARTAGAGALKRPVLVALGITLDGKKEIIDVTLAPAESAAAWEAFLGDLIKRGLTGNGLEMICVDGGAGLLAALPTAIPAIPVQRCWAHKIGNVLTKVRQADHGRVKASLHAIMNADTLAAAKAAARKFADRWEQTYPQAVACLRNDLDELLTCFRYCAVSATVSAP